MNENYRWLGKKRPNSLESLVNKIKEYVLMEVLKKPEKKKKEEV